MCTCSVNSEKAGMRLFAYKNAPDICIYNSALLP